MAAELVELHLARPDEEAQAVEEQLIVLQTEGGRVQALVGLAEAAAVAVRLQLVRVEVVEDIE